MDLCHCAAPQPTKTDHGAQVCTKCRLFYDPEVWKADPRVKAIHEKEALEIVNIITKHTL